MIEPRGGAALIKGRRGYRVEEEEVGGGGRDVGLRYVCIYIPT